MQSRWGPKIASRFLFLKKWYVQLLSRSRSDKNFFYTLPQHIFFTNVEKRKWFHWIDNWALFVKLQGVGDPIGNINSPTLFWRQSSLEFACMFFVRRNRDKIFSLVWWSSLFTQHCGLRVQSLLHSRSLCRHVKRKEEGGTLRDDTKSACVGDASWTLFNSHQDGYGEVSLDQTF